MRLRNTSQLSSHVIKDVLRFVKPPGVTNVTVIVTQTKNTYYGGWALPNGGRVKLRINTKVMYPRFYSPYQYGVQKGKRWWIGNVTEQFVVLAAHELRHCWQARANTRRGYAWRARGRFSEVDTEAYALRMLRAWRRR